MRYHIPTYEEVQEILTLNPNPLFYETINIVDGFVIKSYNYRFATYENFIKPIGNKTYIDAKELRGISFIFNSDGTPYKRFICLRKFWNLNQVEETFYKNVKDFKIKNITNKRDGSLIQFIKLPNNKVVAKTKLGFTNSQSEAANRILNGNNKLKNFVCDLLDRDIMPIFELTSFKNRIVLPYDVEKLTLIKIRDNSTGEYLNISDFDTTGIDIVEVEKYTFDEMAELSKTITDKEGWVIELENDLMLKLKTEWYFNSHKALTEDLNHEDVVIQFFLQNIIDDYISKLDPENDKEKLKWINNITNKITKYISDVILYLVPIKLEFVVLVNKLVDRKLAIKKIAIKYKNDKNFTIIMGVLNGKDDVEFITEYILKKTNKLENARIFLKNI